MKISRAVSTLKKNGWTVSGDVSSMTCEPVIASKSGQRNIRIIPNGPRVNDEIAVIAVALQSEWLSYQPDAATDSRYCDTIKEAMRVA